MSAVYKDHSKEVLAMMNTNEGRALTAIGMAAVEQVTNYMEHEYGEPIKITGDLKGDVNFKVRAADREVDIGNSLNYAIWVHNGTRRMEARPYLKDAITENTQMWKEIAAEHLGEGFGGSI